MSYLGFGGWVKGSTPGFHAEQASASITSHGKTHREENTYTKGSLTETTNTLPAFLSLSWPI